jgi:hypothetical protein
MGAILPISLILRCLNTAATALWLVRDAGGRASQTKV